MRFGPILQISLFAAFLLSGTVFMLMPGHVPTGISESENRTLATAPKLSLQSLRTGQYLRELENYAADHITYRDTMIGLSKTFTACYGWQSREQTHIVTTEANNTGAAQPEQETAEQRAAESPAPQASQPAIEHSVSAPVRTEEKGHVTGKVLITGDRAMNLFLYSSEAGSRYAQAINRLAEKLQADEGTAAGGFRVSVLLAPTAAEFLHSAKLRSLSDSQADSIQKVYGQLAPSILAVQALPVLKAHAEEDLYFRTDHHWTATGAYYAYSAFLQAIDMKPVPLTDFETDMVQGFLGSLYSATLNKSLEKHPDTIVLYRPRVPHQYVVHYKGPLQMNLLDMSHASKKNKYRIFLSGDRPWGLITTETPGDRKIAVVKDSYGNALVPFLVEHFREIYVIDPRQFEPNLPDFIKAHKIHEILFVNNVEVTMDQGFAEQLARILNK